LKRFLMGTAFSALLTSNIAFAQDANEIDLGKLPSPQQMIEQQMVGQYSELLTYLDTSVLQPFIKTYSEQRFDLGALNNRLKDLKKKNAEGKAIGEELDKFNSDIQVLKKRISNYYTQKNALQYTREHYMHDPNKEGAEKYGWKELHERYAELKRRIDADEDIGDDLDKFKADAQKANGQVWEDYKAKQGWKW
jgi:hypothetical protein